MQATKTGGDRCVFDSKRQYMHMQDTHALFATARHKSRAARTRSRLGLLPKQALQPALHLGLHPRNFPGTLSCRSLRHRLRHRSSARRSDRHRHDLRRPLRAAPHRPIGTPHVPRAGAARASRQRHTCLHELWRWYRSHAAEAAAPLVCRGHDLPGAAPARLHRRRRHRRRNGRCTG